MEQQQGETKRITVVKGKGSVQVLDWGRAPFAIERTKRGNAFIPSGFRIRCKSDSQHWIGETDVQDSQPFFQFILESDQTIRSGWHATSTAAYNEANRLAKNEKFNKGSNGRLIIGVTYPILQKLICDRNDLPFDCAPDPAKENSRRRRSSRTEAPHPPGSASPKRAKPQKSWPVLDTASESSEHHDHIMTVSESESNPDSPASVMTQSMEEQESFSFFDDDVYFLLDNLTSDDILADCMDDSTVSFGYEYEYSCPT